MRNEKMSSCPCRDLPFLQHGFGVLGWSFGVLVGFWGRAKLSISNLIKKFKRDGLFWVYIAIFMIKNRIIDGLRFPQFKCTFTGLNAAALCHRTILYRNF
jgi:hypothetical protein